MLDIRTKSDGNTEYREIARKPAEYDARMTLPERCALVGRLNRAFHDAKSRERDAEATFKASKDEAEDILQELQRARTFLMAGASTEGWSPGDHLAFMRGESTCGGKT